MERVSGIGGFFFKADDPPALERWYADQLGVNPVPTSYGESPWWQQAGPTALSAMPADSETLGDRPWCINFRVADLDAMVQQLRQAGHEVEVDPEPYPIGRFATLADPEGNPIQLWEPTAASLADPST